MVGTDPTPFTLKPPLLGISHNYSPSPERPGSLTPPSAAVPFRWEESPGKPKPCTAIVEVSRKSLELPPRLLRKEVSDDGGLKHQSEASSFRMVGVEWFGSLREESGFRGVVEVSRKRKGALRGYWKRMRSKAGERREAVGGGSYVFPSSADRETDDDGVANAKSVEIGTKAAGSAFSVVSSTAKPPRFWGGMCEGLKHAVPWRIKKTNKEGGYMTK